MASTTLTLPVEVRAADTPVQVWFTAGDESTKLAAQAPTSFSGTGQEPENITVDANDRHQAMLGFGASMTGASAQLISELQPTDRDRLIRELFSTSEGIGLNYLRQPMGSTDFNRDGAFYTYSDSPGHFSIQRDEDNQVLPMLRLARAANSGLRIMGSPWSPPAWMKTNGNLRNGGLRTEHHGAYADYFVKFVQEYGKAGVPVADLTVQNEPLFGNDQYPSLRMLPQQHADFVRILDQRLQDAALSTAIWGYDHNWGEQDYQDARYPLELFELASGVKRLVGASFHCYGGNWTSQQRVIAAGKRVVFTECSGSDSANTFRDTLINQFNKFVIQVTRNGSESVILWNLALDQNGGPHQGYCGNRCNGVVEVANGRYTKNAEYYVLGHASKFVRRNAVRIGSNSNDDLERLQNVAYQNPDGSRVLLVVNPKETPQRFSVTENGRSFSYELPRQTVATFTWPGAPGGGPGTVLDRSGWTASASSSPADPCCTGDVPARALDGNLGTRWSTGHGQQPNQWFQVDLGSVQQFNRLVMDAASSGGDYPRRYEIYASNDPTSWGSPIAVGSGSGQLSSVSFPIRSARYLRVVQAGSAGNWWSIHELNLYR